MPKNEPFIRPRGGEKRCKSNELWISARLSTMLKMVVVVVMVIVVVVVVLKVVVVLGLIDNG